MIRLHLTAFLCAVGSATAAVADTLEQCGELNFAHSGERGHRDIGSGVVSYRVFSIGHGIGSQTLFVEGCASGEVISATFHVAEMHPGQDDIVTIEAADATYAVLEDAINSDEVVTFAQLQRRFERAGAEVSRALSSRESCACNRAYPDLRGTRQQFEWYN